MWPQDAPSQFPCSSSRTACLGIPNAVEKKKTKRSPGTRFTDRRDKSQRAVKSVKVVLGFDTYESEFAYVFKSKHLNMTQECMVFYFSPQLLLKRFSYLSCHIFFMIMHIHNNPSVPLYAAVWARRRA